MTHIFVSFDSVMVNSKLLSRSQEGTFWRMILSVEWLCWDSTVSGDKLGDWAGRAHVGESATSRDSLVVQAGGIVVVKLTAIHLCRIVRLRRGEGRQGRYYEEKNHLYTRNGNLPPFHFIPSTARNE